MAYRFDSWDCLWQLPCRSAAQQQHLLAQPTPSPSPSSTTPLVNVSGTGALVFIGVLALAVAILWFIPTFYDLRRTDKWRSDKQSKLLEKMVDKASIKGLSVEDVRQIASAMNTPPRGIQGLTQALIGLIITTLVGVAMVATLVSTAADSSDLRKTIITALLSILGTIAGFYFGARTAQISSEQATRPPIPSPGPTTGPKAAPTVTGVSPKSGPTAGGQVVTVTGSGFTGATTVSFDTTAALNLTVASDTQLTVTSPPGAAGTVHVTVTTPAGTSTTTPDDQYTYND